MVTKKTRALSIIATVVMLVSMLACFVIPASAADGDGVAAIKAMYADVLANASADADGALAAALAAEYGDADAASAALAEAAKGITLNEGVQPRFAYEDAYVAAGFAFANDKTCVMSVSTKEDWYAFIDYSKTQSNCNVSVNVTNDIDFNNEPMDPVSYGKNYYIGILDGQNHVFKNVNISVPGNAGNAMGAALIARAYTAEIKNLGIESGLIQTTGATAGYTAGILGQANGTIITNCWNGATIKAETSTGARTGTTPAGIVSGSGAATLTNCYNVGTIIGTVAANGIFAYTANTGKNIAINCINAGKVVASNAYGVALLHPNFVKSAASAPLNSYTVGNYAPIANADNYAVTGTDVDSTATLPGDAAWNLTNYNAYYGVATVGEAAYKANANANGSVFYTLKNGELALGNAENQVRQIKIVRGDFVSYAYAAPGSVKLADVVPGYADATSVVVKNDALGTNSAINEGVFTMPQNSVTITVVDTVKSAKAALAAAEYTAWDKEDINMYTETIAWWNAVDTLLESGTDVAAILAKAAEIDTILAGSLNVDSAALAPYSKKGVYKNNVSSGYSINSAADWYLLTNDEVANGVGNCTTNINVNRDIYFDSDVNTYPLNYGGYYLGKLDGQFHTFNGLKIHQQATSSATSVGLTSYINGATNIKQLGLVNCSIKATSITAGSVGGFAGHSNGGGQINRCWIGEGTVVEAANTVIGTSGPFVGGIIGYANGNTIKNCYNIGTVKGTAIAGGIIGGYGTSLKNSFNNISAGTIIAPNANSRIAGTIIHYNFSSTAPTNSYTVGYPAIAPCNGSTWTNDTYASADAYNAALSVDSVEEAAYKATAGNDGVVYYTMKDGKLAFGTATDRVQKITITRGSSSTIAYAVSNEAVDLFAINPALASAESITSSDVEIAYGKFTMANKDVIITVNDSIESAKAALAAKIEEAWAAEDLNMYDQTQAWLDTAEDLVANGTDASVIVAQVAAIDTILAGELTLDLTAYAPYSKKANYPNNSTTKFSINTANDWIQLTKDYAGKSTGADLELHVNRDIEFNGTPMSPLCYNGTGQAIFYGKIFGNGHTFKNVNITGAPVSHDYIGVGLISAVMSGAAVDGLGLTGNITNTAAGTCAGVFVGARAYGASFTNCWSDVDLVTEGTNTSTTAAEQAQYVGIIGSRRIGELTIKNCHFNGSITAKVGSVALIPYTPSNVDVINTINNVTLVKGGSDYRAAMTIAHTNTFGGGTSFVNTYSVGSDLIQFTNGSDKTDGTTTFASSAEMQNYYNTTYGAATVKEAAYKATAGANGDVYYTLKDGELAFGTATDRVFKVKLIGDFEAEGYYLPGEVVTLADLGLPADEGIELSGADIVDGKVTVDNADIIITVSYGESQTAAKKEELKALIDRYAAIDQNIIEAGSTVITWLEAANEIYADPEATFTEVKTQIFAADGVSATMKSGYYVPFGGKDTSYSIVNAGNHYGIYTEADWEALVAAGSVSMHTLHIMNDITFTKSHLPVAYGGGKFTGDVNGHNHVLTIKMNFADTDATSGVGLFSKFAGDHTIKNLGLAGTLNYELNGSAGSKYIGGFVGATEQRIQFIKCFTTLDITINKAQHGGHFVGGTPTLNTRYDGCFAAGSFNSTYTDCGGFTGGYTGNAHELFNSFDATTSDNTWMLRIHSGTISTETGEDANGKAGNIYAVGKNVYSFNNGDHQAVSGSQAYIAWAEAHELEADAYATGEVGYLLNQGYTEKTGTRVYYSYDYANKAVVFGADDGSDQVRKLTYSGIAEGTMYINQGDAVPFADIAGTAAKYYVDGEQIMDLASFTMPAGDVVMTVEAEYDVDAYNAANIGLSALKAEYEGYNLDLFENGAEMKQLLNDIDFLYEDEDAIGIIAKWAEVQEAPIALDLKEGKYVPYATKANYSKLNATEFGIYSVADWNAAAAAGGSANLHLMNNIDFENAETATFASYAGTFDGHSFQLENIKITTVVGNNVGLFRGLGANGTVKDVEITGAVDVKLGTMDAKVSGAVAIAVVAANASAGTITGVTNRASITADVYSTGRVYIGTICGDRAIYTNCTNYGDVTVNGVGAYIGVGGMAGRTGAVVSGDKNYGNVTLNTQRNNDNYAYVGGISGATSGDSLANVENHGTITLNGGSHAAVGGIQGYGTDGNDSCTIGSALNTGAINVTMDEGASVVYVGGIIGQAMWPVTEGAVLSNSGAITVEVANAYSGASVGGIAGTMSALAEGTFAATNEGDIVVGGMDAANEKHVAAQVVAKANNATVNATENGSLTVCAHAAMNHEKDAENHQHIDICPDCSFKAYVACDGDWTYGAKEDFVTDGNVVTSTHTMTCAVCGQGYDEECVGTLVTNPADCTAGTHVEFDCVCGREDVVLVEGNAEHNYGEYSTEGATEGYERAYCTNGTCECYHERLIEVTFSATSEGFKPGEAATATFKVVTGLLTEGTFTVTAPEGVAIENATFTVEDLVDGAYTINYTATGIYEDIEFTVAIADAKLADGSDASFENVTFTAAINVVRGDASGDGTVNLIDAIIALRESVDANAAGVCNIANADMDGDGVVTADDAVAIVRAWLKAN